MKCSFRKYNLQFKEAGTTSRGTLLQKETFILTLADKGRVAYGECNLFRGLAFDDRRGYEEKLAEVCDALPTRRWDILEELTAWPSIRFGVETVLRDADNGFRRVIFKEIVPEEGFTIPANGLIWMGSDDVMKKRIEEKLQQGYKNIKLKIGALDFEREVGLLRYIRNHEKGRGVTIRLDANGAFGPQEALEKLKRLSDFGIEYLEQPIRQGMWQEMAAIIEKSPIPIALDEELIGINSYDWKVKLIDTLRPPFLILKPALTGGFASCDEWNQLAKRASGECVITSALESNIGLNAIAQYTATLNPVRPQGLGTGTLFTNNFGSPYLTDALGLHYDPLRHWDLSLL
ncbi:MAG: o-succinylbenzoate synthase [Chitinophagaceae bacterium]|nr:o-succinylbenzoate synthase [Chitinophagaceae bacterium]MCW5915024.1 o-succinylbenzoate synthase [Chitinophagaceae bacterium]MCZ2396707.1 o-succinylbenzoate synthase [Chitinophagales bacterium]